MKKAFCIVSGVILIVTGSAGLFIAVTGSGSGLFFIGPILIVAGGWLFSFKRAAWKLALFTYGILLLYLTYLNVTGYAIALYMSGSGPRPQFFSIGNVVSYLQTGIGILFQGLWLICACFFCVLLTSRRDFK